MEAQRLVESDVEIIAQPRSLTSKLFSAGVAVALFGTGAWVGNHFAPHDKDQLHAGDSTQLEEIIAKPKRGQCSSWKDNCLETGCCNVAGLTCFQIKEGKGKCLKNCTASSSQMCTQPQFVMDPILQPAAPVAQSLYCFSVYTQNTGTTKPSEELDVIKYQYSQQISIFNCEQSEVFADVEVEFGPGRKTIMVEDVEGDWHFAKRKVSGSWVNTGMFTQVWKKIQESGKIESADWVAKVDADAVFIPNRLRLWLSNQMVPDNGIYLEDCKFVDYGYFGNLEVFSRQAFKILLDNIDLCKASTEINWKTGVKNGKYGPMGEDLFAQACLDLKGVRRVEAFDITTDGACPADRPDGEKKNKKWQPNCAETSTAAMHPFKKLAEWTSCHDATVAAFGE